MKGQTLSVFITLIFLFTYPVVALAQETSGSFAGGSVKVGSDTRTCDSSLEGAIRYDTTTNVLQFCDGTDWTPPSTIFCTVGDAVGDGICAGRSEGRNLIVTQAGCDFNDASAAACNETIDNEFEWGVNGWGDLDNPYNDMEQANADYFAYASANTIDVSTYAAAMCASLTIDGEDWYLPTIPQLIEMNANQFTGSWTGGSFIGTDRYLSINIRDANNSEAMDFDGDDVDSTNSQFTTRPVRCVRLD